MRCPFCAIPDDQVIASNDLALAVRDRYPVSPGHSLVVPRRHVGSWFEADDAERAALLALVDEVRGRLEVSHRPDGYNIGINIGADAGQTVMHLHMHVIPRYRGDVDDPRGGVRFVIPERGSYERPGFIPSAHGAEAAPSSRRPPLATGGVEDPFLRHLEPLFARADQVDIVAAFVRDTGVTRLESRLHSCLDRGAGVRVLTGDYLNSTQARALRALLDLATAESLAEADEGEADGGLAVARGGLSVRVIEVEALLRAKRGTSFHPKSWIFRGPGLAAAYVGSSNLTETALSSGVEWNLLVEGVRDPQAFAGVSAAFETWWSRARPVTADWIDEYAERARRHEWELPVGEVDEPVAPPPQPRDLQVEALEALRSSRREGHQRGLVVMATGLGKTWAAAFDVAQVAESRGRMPRVLLLAHRMELLRQAWRTFRRLFPDRRFGWYAGAVSQPAGDVVLASVMKLGRRENLARFAPDEFDYIVVDEVHHAHARTYRRILDHFEPAFLLGLTATPERSDGGDVLGMFDDHVAYEADLGVGIATGHLVPFDYFGLKDTVDYAPIPWRNRRFDPAALAEAVQTQARMQQLWGAWQEHRATRTLVFCCSIAHAHFVRDWLEARGVRAVAVHSGPESDDREEALLRLTRGELDAVCSVDLFNEGIDVPSVDRAVMLRPTESSLLFLQQLGRGLRTHPDSGKQKLTVIDFVGNHRVFLDRVRTLLSLGAKDRGGETPLGTYLDTGEAQLPAGCSIALELEAVDLLKRLLPSGHKNVLVRAYRELRHSRGERPTIGELYRLGYNPASLGEWDGWFEFVRAEGDLTEAEAQALAQGADWLFELERRERMTKSFKMVTVEALLEADAVFTGMDVAALARRSHAVLERSPELFRDLESTRDLRDPARPDPEVWLKYWTKNPLQHWASWFRIHGGRFEPRGKLVVPESVREALGEMTREVVDYRLARYRKTRVASATGGGTGFDCKLIQTNGRPIVKLPSRDQVRGIPEGETDVRLSDGSYWRFRFVKLYCNVAHPVGVSSNRLPDLLRRWFGPDAGQPGTDHHIRFAPSPDGWWVEPVERPGAEVILFPKRNELPSFPELRAAAGWDVAGAQAESALAPELVTLPGDFDRDTCFAVRASGTSMDGWRSEIRDGDWLVMRWARGDAPSAIEGRVALIGRGDPESGRTFHLKRVVKAAKGVGTAYELRSDNPEFPPMAAEGTDEPLAVLVRAIRPEELAPQRGTCAEADELAGLFGLSEELTPPWSRVDGHLFVMVEGRGSLETPDRVRVRVPKRRPGETAFVLGRGDTEADWKYLGVGRWLDDEGLWTIPEVDFETWRALGRGRTASRRLPPEWEERARQIVTRLLDDPGVGAWVERGGLGPSDSWTVAQRRYRIVGESPRGGLRIDGGEGGFAERTVSLLDIGWVLLARTRTAGERGAASSAPDARRVDEAQVNRLRYLEGTPKASTRWIDTGWAMALVQAVAGSAKMGHDPK